MKILFTVHSYYPNKDGVQMVTQTLAENLTKLGHNITVLTSQIANMPKQETHNQVQIIRYPLKTKYGLYFGNHRKYVSYIKEMAQSFDLLVNICTQNAFTDLLLPHLSSFSCKKILYMHGMHNFHWKGYQFRSIRSFLNKLWKDIKWGILYLFSQKYFRQYDSIIQLHPVDYACQFFQKHYNLQCDILENTIDDRFFDIKQTSSTHNIICVANYLVDKNQELLLKAFYKSSCTKEYTLTCIGSKPTSYYYYLLKLNKALEKRYGKRQITLLHSLTREDTIQYIKNAYCYLFSSLHEVYPLSIMEAMAAGIPFISTDVGCVRALPGGLIIRNLEEMVYALNLLITQPDLARQLGNLGATYALKHFKMNIYVDTFNKILKRSIL